MYLTSSDHQQINEMIDFLTMLISQTGSPIEQEFVEAMRRNAIALSLCEDQKGQVTR